MTLIIGKYGNYKYEVQDIDEKDHTKVCKGIFDSIQKAQEYIDNQQR